MSRRRTDLEYRGAEDAEIDCLVLWSRPVDDERLRALLDEDERARYARLVHPEDRARFVTGRALAKTTIGRHLGIPPRELRFESRCRHCGGPHGKPCAPGIPVNFSLSHSGDRVVFCMAEGVETGVDVERIVVRDFERLAPRVLSSAEISEFETIAPEERMHAYYRYWTRKEALLKAVGRGLDSPMPQITVTGPEQSAGLVEWNGEFAESAFTLATLYPGPGYAAALAIGGGGRIAVTERVVGDPCSLVA
ncbi:4'-phosphopantetheinyl transferase family protein [Nocardia sp. NPDC051570]|uniref:4'-phosphopantetheinyl transferase family protein n=1 Tax=Nocardia sp. NPDC051570 TaxID=3364324 RepID=UPI0037A7F16A